MSLILSWQHSPQSWSSWSSWSSSWQFSILRQEEDGERLVSRLRQPTSCVRCSHGDLLCLILCYLLLLSQLLTRWFVICCCYCWVRCPHVFLLAICYCCVSCSHGDLLFVIVHAAARTVICYLLFVIDEAVAQLFSFLLFVICCCSCCVRCPRCDCHRHPHLLLCLLPSQRE